MPTHTNLLTLLLIILALLLPTLAAAQSDIVVRPTAAISPTQVLTTAVGAGQGLTNCLVLEGADPLNVANHFECQAVLEAAISEHTITIISGEGHVTVRAVTVRVELDGSVVVSDPSPNFKKVLDVPGPPHILSGTGDKVGDLG